MKPEDRFKIVEAMREARKKARKYADFFSWPLDRDLEELGVLRSLFESMEMRDALPYTQLRLRGRGNDPPDCEALDSESRRVAIEVTELVDEEAIRNAKAGQEYEWADWNREKFLSRLDYLLRRKDERFPDLKDPPYEGGYVVVVFTDEPSLSAENVKTYLEGCEFTSMKNITEALFLVSYEPQQNCCPHFQLRIGS